MPWGKGKKNGEGSDQKRVGEFIPTEGESLVIGCPECSSLPFVKIGDFLTENGVDQARIEPLKGIIRNNRQEAQLRAKGGAERK